LSNVGHCIRCSEIKHDAFSCHFYQSFPDDTELWNWLQLNLVNRVIFCLFLDIDVRLYNSWMPHYFPRQAKSSDTQGSYFSEFFGTNYAPAMIDTVAWSGTVLGMV